MSGFVSNIDEVVYVGYAGGGACERFFAERNYLDLLACSRERVRPGVSRGPNQQSFRVV